MINNVTPLFILSFIISIVFSGFYFGKVKEAGKKKKLLLIYLTVTAIILALTGTIGLIEFARLPFGLFISALVWATIVGSLHAWLFEKLIPLENRITGRILFTFAVCFFGFGLILMSFKLFYHSPFPSIYFLPAFTFVAPVFVSIAFSFFVKIPMKIYKEWHFPAPGTLSDPSDSEMANPIIVNFEICKRINDSKTDFKAKAPRGMELGKLFYFFIMDYNSRHPDNPILIEDSDHKTYKWSFSIMSGIIKGKNHLDPDISVADNKLKENTSVICERIIQ